jgi:hypothetical protein
LDSSAVLEGSDSKDEIEIAVLEGSEQKTAFRKNWDCELLYFLKRKVNLNVRFCEERSGQQMSLYVQVQSAPRFLNHPSVDAFNFIPFLLYKIHFLRILRRRKKIETLFVASSPIIVATKEIEFSAIIFMSA